MHHWLRGMDTPGWATQTCKTVALQRLSVMISHRSDYQTDVCWQISNTIKQTT